jgi:hypothetical protein
VFVRPKKRPRFDKDAGMDVACAKSLVRIDTTSTCNYKNFLQEKAVEATKQKKKKKEEKKENTGTTVLVQPSRRRSGLHNNTSSSAGCILVLNGLVFPRRALLLLRILVRIHVQTRTRTIEAVKLCQRLLPASKPRGARHR